MTFIVQPIVTTEVCKGGPDNHTMCVLCSEDPRFCI